MMLPPLNFEGFDGREEELKKITRYHKYPTMFYRTDLVIHTNRLVWMIETCAEAIFSIYPDFDLEKARTYAAIHDDPEIVTGDIQFGAKLVMSKEERQQVSDDEMKAIGILKERFPKILNGFVYADLLEEYENLAQDNLEGTISKYFDKLDAFCEALHELHAGNEVFARGFAADIGTPAGVYINVFEDFPTTWPLFGKLRDSGMPIFSLPGPLEEHALVQAGKLHTAPSLLVPSAFPHYDLWRQISIVRGGKDAVAQLTEQIES